MTFKEQFLLGTLQEQHEMLLSSERYGKETFLMTDRTDPNLKDLMYLGWQATIARLEDFEEEHPELKV